MTDLANNKLAILVNPMAGRDVRRVAARASTVTHESKMDMVARAASGADAMGIDEIFIVSEPFRIAERALEWMPLKAKVSVLKIELQHKPSDTLRAAEAFIGKGVNHIVALGGDGTHRVIVKATTDICLIPLSTGTNNVYPLTVEPTIVGMVAALGAQGRLCRKDLGRRSKLIHFSIGDRVEDIGLIDVVRMENDFIGNFRPFNPANIQELILSRAEPDAIGMSPIGGLIDPVSEEEDAGLLVRMGGGLRRRVPISPGHFRDVCVKTAERMRMEEERVIDGPGIIAVDGDRLYQIGTGEQVVASIRRDGPFVYDIARAMNFAAQQGLCSEDMTRSQ